MPKITEVEGEMNQDQMCTKSVLEVMDEFAKIFKIKTSIEFPNF